MSIISTTKRLPHGLVFPFIAATSLFAHSVNGADKPVQPQRPKLIAYARPLSFEPNRGQTRPRVDFLAHGIGYELFLSRADAVLVFTQRPIAKQISRRSGFSIPRSVDAAMVRMRPADGDRAAEVSGVQELPGKSNYFIGSASEKWRTNIPTYAKVLYRNVYPGVDLLDYGNQAQLEYDFVVSPGAEANAISLAFEGATKIDVDRSSELVMKTSAGEMRWHKPMAYQEIAGKRKLVACTYVQKEADRFGFALGSYDHAKPLIIDPVLEYSTYLGGTSDDQAEGIAVDEHGFAYVTGFTTSSDFPTSNPFQQGLRGQLNAFVSKFDIDGKSLIYFTYLGGSDLDEAESIAVDDFGYAYVTGLAFSADFPIKNPLQRTLKGSESAFVTKLGRNGDSLVYSTYLGGSGSDVGRAIAVDHRGHAFVAGEAFSSDFPTRNAFQPKLRGISNAFVTKLGASGNTLLYSTYLGGGGDDFPNGIAVDDEENAYVAGSTNSLNFPTKNAFQEQLKSLGSAFVTKLSSDGRCLVYSTYLGGVRWIYGWQPGYGNCCRCTGARIRHRFHKFSRLSDQERLPGESSKFRECIRYKIRRGWRLAGLLYVSGWVSWAGEQSYRG
jgi:hypothetical protein